MRKQLGTSLIEILVTVLIVSFGLLGVAGVVSNGLKNNHSSYGRTQASILAADIVDRMRANRTDAESVAAPYNLTVTAATPATAASAPVAQQDLIAWRTAIAATLPAGTGAVNVDAATKKVTVTVRWDDSRGTGGSNTQSFVLETRL